MVTILNIGSSILYQLVNIRKPDRNFIQFMLNYIQHFEFMFYEKFAFKTIEHWLNFMFVMLKIFLSDSASNFLRDRIKNKHTDNQKTNKQTTSNRNTNTCNNTKP